MLLANFEFFANSGVAVVGATVTPYVASDVHPNPNAPAASSTTTDTNGKWSFPALADGQLYDVKVVYGTSTKWYKGNARLALGHLYDDTTPDPNRNLLPNGGLDGWVRLGTGVIALPTSDPGTENAADGFVAHVGTGDVGTIQASSAVRATNSKYSAQIIHTRSAGQARLYREIPTPLLEQLRGQAVPYAVQVFQQAASASLRAFITDSAGTTTSASTSVVGSWVTLTVFRTVAAAATSLRVGVETVRSDTGARTFYVDNLMVDLGSTAPVFAPEQEDAGPSILYWSADDSQVPVATAHHVGRLLDNLANRIKALTGEASWLSTAARTLAQKVNRDGDTMTGGLGVPNLFVSDTVPNSLVTQGGISANGNIATFGTVTAAGYGAVNATTVSASGGISTSDVSANSLVTGGGGSIGGNLVVVGSVTANGGFGAMAGNTLSLASGSPNSLVTQGGISAQGSIGTFGGLIGASLTIGGNPATTLPGAGRIPIADASGRLDAWVTGGTGGGGGSGTVLPAGIGLWVPAASGIPTGYTRYTAANGRILVGEGSSLHASAPSFVGGGQAGSSWTHIHTDNGHSHAGNAHNHSGANMTVAGTAASSSNTNGLATAGGVTLNTSTHSHAVSGTVGGNTENTTQSVQSGNASIQFALWDYPTAGICLITKL